jgi:hypothetical protein
MLLYTSAWAGWAGSTTGPCSMPLRCSSVMHNVPTALPPTHLNLARTWCTAGDAYTLAWMHCMPDSTTHTTRSRGTHANHPTSRHQLAVGPPTTQCLHTLQASSAAASGDGDTQCATPVATLLTCSLAGSSKPLQNRASRAWCTPGSASRARHPAPASQQAT